MKVSCMLFRGAELSVGKRCVFAVNSSNIGVFLYGYLRWKFTNFRSLFWIWIQYRNFSPIFSLSSIRRDIPEDVLNTYCWIHSTYTVVDAFMKKQGLEVPFPGVDNSQGGRGPLTIKHNKYYQWVAFTLFFQVRMNYLKCFFFLP